MREPLRPRALSPNQAHAGRPRVQSTTTLRRSRRCSTSAVWCASQRGVPLNSTWVSGLSVEQVVSWFVNARKRVWRPAMRRKEAEAAKPQRARVAVRKQHEQQAGTTSTFAAVDGYVQRELGTAPQARKVSAQLGGWSGPSFAQPQAVLQTSCLTLGFAQAPCVLPTYPLYSSSEPWEELAVLHSPASPRHDNWMMQVGRTQANEFRFF